MATIGFSIIGHHEGHLLPRCLEAIAWADQIVYVDIESADDSVAIAKRYTPHVFSRPNDQNFNRNKQWALEHLTTDWIFYLDPDEVIPPDLAEEIKALVAANPPHAAYELPRRNFFFGRWVRHGSRYPDTQLRLFRRGQAHFPCVDVHEKLAVQGSIGRLKHPFDHHTTFTPQTMMDKAGRNTTYYAVRMYRQGKRPGVALAAQMLVLTPLRRFVNRYVFKLGFLDGLPGFFLILLDNFEFVLRYTKLWHYTRHPEQLPPDDFLT